MKVEAVVHGAVSIVNAIPLGIGSALGVDLTTKAIVEVEESKIETINIDIYVEGEEDVDKSLAENTIRELLRIAKGTYRVDVKIYSNIPIARGLKSSSAAADAIVLAASKALDLELSTDQLVNMAVDISIKSGVTVTGAYDDALTCMIGGVNITDNLKRKILAHWDLDEDISIIIMIPPEKFYTKEVDVGALRSFSNLSMRAVEQALNGNIWDAMIINGLVVSSALNIDYTPVLRALKKKAIAAGISGKGPSIVAVTYPEHEEEVKKELERFGRVVRVKPNNREAYVRILD
ncbi:MAG: shikimate kinase [Nitrososphaerota archaeon]